MLKPGAALDGGRATPKPEGRFWFMYHQIPPPITMMAKMIHIHGMSPPVVVGAVLACASAAWPPGGRSRLGLRELACVSLSNAPILITSGGAYELAAGQGCVFARIDELEG